jgi:predicted amidohydrolase
VPAFFNLRGDDKSFSSKGMRGTGLMRVGVYQNRPVFGEVDLNVEKAVQDLSAIRADLVVLPELFNTGYQFLSRQEAESLAEEIPSGGTCRAMISLAAQCGMHLVFGLAEKDGSAIYNSAAVAGPNGLLGAYRKVHLFSNEKDHFDPGDTGFRVFDLGPAVIGVMICFDWLFPESARVLALNGAHILCHPANLVLPHCQRAMRTRSLENGVFSLTANRVGMESRGGMEPLTFTGQSQIVDNRGRILTRLGEKDTGILLADMDPELAADKAITEKNDRLADRRPEFYGNLSQKCV